jgi:WD40 repeat protein/DNA-binding SARP family transcriptional activator
MQFRILGPLEVTAESGGAVALGGARARALLAVLLLHANQPVSAERLAVALWGDDAPSGAIKTVQVHMSRLRKALGDGEIVQTTPAGYRLWVGPGELDSERFDGLVDAGRRALADGEPQLASSLLREALGLWRGPPLSDLAHEPFAAAEVRRLEERRLAAMELAIEGDLAVGCHGEVVGELESLVAEHPLRERLHAQRMLALYRCGRQAEALEAFRDARRLLVEEIGVEPGAALRELHESILRQDASLDLERRAAMPHELDAQAGQAMVGRDEEVAWLRERWRRARAGSGELVAVIGEPGIGKTRLAAELAHEVHRGGATVMYATGGTRSAVVAAVRSVREATGPTLLVVDDADADDDAIGELRELAPRLAAAPVLTLATAEADEAGALLGARSALALEPLDADGVRRIALLYAPNHAGGNIPVEELAQASRGVPGRIHELASGWARQEAQRRVAAEARRTEAGRSELRSAEEELAGGVIDLQEARQRAELGVEHEGPVVCPFKGLVWFDVEDAGFFFGRERLVAEMVARLAGAPLMGIVGPSGSGKSSALRAGLVPALAAGVLPGSERWALALVRPGEHPLRALEQATGEAAPRARLVVAVDQFEEAFTACREESERAAFFDALVSAARDPHRRAVVLLAVRADFYGRCAAYPELWRLLGANQVPVGPMRRDELRRAIELPARRAGLRVEPDLVDALIADVEGEPGGLPLLSTSLLELWPHRDGRRLRLSAYEQAGGVHGAVARLAEGAFTRLDAGQQRMTRAILLRLAGEGEGDAAVRARVPLGEFGADAGPVLAELTDSRLLTVGEGEVEVAHEALLREWPRLRGWLEEDVQGRRLQRHLRAAAREWQAGGRDPGELYRGARLVSALDWASDHGPELNATERAFLADGRAASERAQRRLRMLLAGVATLLVLAVIAGVVALDQRSGARNQARVAEAQRLGVQALAEPRLDRSLLLARQGVELDDSLTTRSNLLEALLRSPAAIRVLRGAGHPLDALDLSADGRTLAAGDIRGNVLFFDAVTGRRAGPRYTVPVGGISAVRFSPDGTLLAVATDEFVDILDARTHRYMRHLVAAPPSLSGAVNFPWVLGNVAFSPDSRVLAADAIHNGLAPGSCPPCSTRRRAYIVRWSARTGHLLGPPRQVARAPEPALVGFTASGRLVTASAADRATVIRDAATLRPLRRLRSGGTPSALSPDGRVVALGAADGSVRLLDLRTGDLRVAADRHDAAVTDLRFTRDSRGLLTTGDDGRVKEWNVADARLIETFTGHASTVSRVAIAPDRRTAYSAGQDGTVIAWDLFGTRRLDRPFSAPPRSATVFFVFVQGKSPTVFAPMGIPVPVAGLAVATTPDGGSFAVPDDAGYVDTFDSRTPTRPRRIPVSPGTQVSAVALAPNGRTVAATTADGHLRFADLRDRRPLGPLLPAYAGTPANADKPSALTLAWSLAFSGDGRWLATAGAPNQSLRLWDVRRRRIASTSYLLPYPLAGDVTFSPDGTKVAATVNDAWGGATAIEILSVPSLALMATVRAPAGRSVRFSPDGGLLAFGDEQGRVWLYNTRTWMPRGRPLVAHTRAVVTVNFSPDGQTLATTSDDGTTRLWDVRSGRPIGTALPGPAQHSVAAAFVGGGTHLVTLDDNGRGHLWDIQPRAWARRACQVAGRTLTRAEWNDALPERTYAPACAGR